MNWILLTVTCLQISSTRQHLMVCVDNPRCNDVCEESGYQGREFKTQEDLLAYLKQHPKESDAALVLDRKNDKVLTTIVTEHRHDISTTKEVVEYDVKLR